MKQVCALMLFLAAALSAPRAAASGDGCSPREIQLAITKTDPAYGSAMQLAAILRSHGVVVQCVLPSKMASILPQQLGAALFRTDHGDFEALFRPAQQNFSDVLISGGRVNDGYYKYLYKNPQGRLLGGWEGRQAFFLKHGNMLFIASEEAIVAALRRTLEE